MAQPISNAGAFARDVIPARCEPRLAGVTENHGTDVAAAGDRLWHPRRAAAPLCARLVLHMPRRPTPPWIFLLTAMPYGVAAAFAGAVMGYMARAAGSDLDAIGWYVSLLLIPTFLQFLYAPVVDFGPRRKHWLVGISVVSAGCMYAAMQLSLKDQMVPFLVLAFLAQAISGLIGACNGGLMATLIPDAKSGQASAFHTVGNLAGGGLSGALVVYLLGHGYTEESVGLVLVACMIVPALAALAIDEPARANTGSLREALAAVLRDVKEVLTSRVGVTGLLLCASPVGTVALSNYFSSIAVDYVQPGMAHQLAALDPEAAKVLLEERVSDVVAWLSGWRAQTLLGLGAFIGGYLCDRGNRRALYLFAGALTAVCGIVMALSPHTEATIKYGALVYALITGFSYAAFTATVLETIGTSESSAGTRYSLFTAGGNAAITYVGFVDTRFHEAHGSSGVIASDALLNLGGVAILALVFWRLGMFRRKS
jgi:MFS family permease